MVRQSGHPAKGVLFLPAKGVEVNECLLGTEGKDCKQREKALQRQRSYMHPGIFWKLQIRGAMRQDLCVTRSRCSLRV